MDQSLVTQERTEVTSGIYVFEEGQRAGTPAVLADHFETQACALLLAAFWMDGREL